MPILLLQIEGVFTLGRPRANRLAKIAQRKWSKSRRDCKKLSTIFERSTQAKSFVDKDMLLTDRCSEFSRWKPLKYEIPITFNIFNTFIDEISTFLDIFIRRTVILFQIYWFVFSTTSVSPFCITWTDTYNSIVQKDLKWKMPRYPLK